MGKNISIRCKKIKWWIC